MDPVTIMIIPGFIGGLVIALLFARFHRKSEIRVASDAFAREPLSADIINIARIRVAGIGGLGLAAMALVVAIYIPGVGQSVAIGLVLGALMAVILVAWRRRAGLMPSSARCTGANTTLSIDSPTSSIEDDKEEPANGRRHH